MNRRRDNDESITLLQAIETLCTIAEIEVDSNIEIEETNDIVLGERKSIEILNLQDRDETVRVVREIFGLLYRYLRGVYNNRDSAKEEDQVVEGIKTIMVLVGEAAKNLDKYTTIFHGAQAQKVTQLDEYKKLQQFYQTRISREVDSKQLSKWIMGLANQAPQESMPVLKGRTSLHTRHEFVDLDAVKKDTEYELFFIRKEDGSRFFSPQLVRNMTLVCDFGDSISGKPANEMIHSIAWQDACARISASDIREAISSMIPRFIRETFKYNNHEIIVDLRSALFALMLASNPRNAEHEDEEKKTCCDYFADFFFFLRRALSTREYQRLVAYPPGADNPFPQAILDMIHGMCYAFFVEMRGEYGLNLLVNELIEKAHPVDDTKTHLWNSLTQNYISLTKLLRRNGNGPLMKVLASIQDGSHQSFDPLWQGNLPQQLYCLFYNDEKIINCGIPCPVHQEAVNRVTITNEFKAFLHSMKDNSVHGHHLIVNLQDRTSWREHARCKALEELQMVPDFAPHLTVVTLAKDTEFYRQDESYGLENHAAVFIESFLDHMEDQSSGYYFPEAIKEQLFPKFMHQMVDAVHRIFFNDKNVLTRDQRMDFIELTYLFIELKLIEIVRPSSFTLMCKDGIDTSACGSGLMFAFFKLLNQSEMSQGDKELLNTILFGPGLLQRERAALPERFNRMVNAIRVIETVRDEWGYENFRRIIKDSFGACFDYPILDALALPQKE